MRGKRGRVDASAKGEAVDGEGWREEWAEREGVKAKPGERDFTKCSDNKG